MTASPDGNPGNSISITGGTFQGSAIGIGHTHQHGATIGAVAGPADLRALLAERAPEIVELGPADDRSGIRHEIDAIDRELGRDEPSGPVVKSRWETVLSVLDSAVKAGSRLSEITDLVHKVFGA
jgi:hypothetical protein